MPAKRLLTAEEYAALPETDAYRRDLIRGGLGAREPPPAYPHATVEAKIFYLLYGFVTARRLGRVTTNEGFLLETNPDTVCAPDVSFLGADRVPAGGRVYTHRAPDLAVEVLSPSNTKKAMAAKVALYLGTGARLVWCVDPQRHIVTVHRRDHQPMVLRAADRLSGEDVLPGFECAVSAVFDTFSL